MRVLISLSVLTVFCFSVYSANDDTHKGIAIEDKNTLRLVKKEYIGKFEKPLFGFRTIGLDQTAEQVYERMKEDAFFKDVTKLEIEDKIILPVLIDKKKANITLFFSQYRKLLLRIEIKFEFMKPEDCSYFLENFKEKYGKPDEETSLDTDILEKTEFIKNKQNMIWKSLNAVRDVYIEKRYADTVGTFNKIYINIYNPKENEIQKEDKNLRLENEKKQDVIIDKKRKEEFNENF
jgi:hypothetical protein